MLAGLTLAFYWIGWRSPWARADETVRVEVADPPKPAPVAAPPPEATMTAASIARSANENAEMSVGDEASERSARTEADPKREDHPRHLHRVGRKHRAEPVADQPLD